MTICNITGYACQCQPDDGVPCVGVADLKAALSEWRQKAEAAVTEVTELKRLLHLRRNVGNAEYERQCDAALCEKGGA